MKNSLLEKDIINSAPKDTPIDKTFTDRVMCNVYSLSKNVNHSEGRIGRRLLRLIRFERMSRLAIATMIFASLGLLGGTSYALYKVLWSQPYVSVQDIKENQYGKVQVSALLESCGQQSTTTEFEVINGVALGKSDVSKILQARCEMKVIEEWSDYNYRESNHEIKSAEGVSKSTTLMLFPAAVVIESVDDNSIKYSYSRGEHKLSDSFNVTDSTLYIHGNNLVDKRSFNLGDEILFLQEVDTKDITQKNRDDEYVTTGTPTSKRAIAVIKPSLPGEYYSIAKQGLVAQRSECLGNPQDSCLNSSTVDIARYEGGFNLRSLWSEVRMIQGVVNDVGQDYISIKSSSGRDIDIYVGEDVISRYRDSKNGDKNLNNIDRGDVIQVSYYSSNESSEKISERQLISIDLVINPYVKGDYIEKY